jgi:hypothetical protein
MKPDKRWWKKFRRIFSIGILALAICLFAAWLSDWRGPLVGLGLERLLTYFAILAVVLLGAKHLGRKDEN